MSKTIATAALDHIVLRVRDIDTALKFYRDLLGLPVQFLDEHRAGLMPFVSVRVGASLIDLLPDPTYDPDLGLRDGGLAHFCIRVTGARLADLVPLLPGCGAEAIEELPVERIGATGAGPSIYVRDPCGYTVELKEESEG